MELNFLMVNIKFYLNKSNIYLMSKNTKIRTTIQMKKPSLFARVLLNSTPSVSNSHQSAIVETAINYPICKTNFRWLVVSKKPFL